MTVEARLARIEDEQAIRALTAFYSDAVTHLDPVRAASVYVEDGCVSVVGLETVGRSAIEAGMRGSFAAYSLLQLIAHGGLIALDGDRATARWSTIELGVRQGKTDLACTYGRYEDELVRLEVGWRFRRRVFTMAGRVRMPAAKLQLNAHFAALMAQTRLGQSD